MSERTLGGYRLLSQLAVGGMAEIYVAKAAGASGWEKLVALKVIHPNFSEDPEFVQMLVDEAKLAVQLQHANIVQTFDLGRVDEQYYIAMELIDGVDLYKLLRQASERELDFPFEIAAFIAQEASSGLDYAHRKRDSKGRPLQIVHRDVSPQNILCSYDGEVKIVDFGIAKAARRGRQTAAGVIKGKYYYMSPEQAWGDPIDGRTDVFSTGILLYEMLVGQMLYLEEDLDTLLDKVRKANIPPPSTRRKDLPTELEGIVMRALRKRADDRFQTAGEMGLALAKFLRDHAPDFNRGRLAAFIQEVLGDDPTSKTRDPRATTAMTRDHLPQDENSLIFKLSELKPEPRPSRKPDQATSPVSLPELQKSMAPKPAAPAPAAPAPTDFEENDATIVDSGGVDALMAGMREQESTRPMGAPNLRELASTPLVDDPARDPDEEETLNGLPPAPSAPTPTMYDEPDQPLPGVRARAEAIAKSANASVNANANANAKNVNVSDRSPSPARAPSPRPPTGKVPLEKAQPAEKPLARVAPARAAAPPARAPVAALDPDDEPDTSQRLRRPTLELRKPKTPDPAPAPPAPSQTSSAAATVNLGPRENPVAGFDEDVDDPTVVPPPRPPPPPSDGWPQVAAPANPASPEVWPPQAQPWPQPAQQPQNDAWPQSPPSTSPSAAIDVGAGRSFFSRRRGRVVLIASGASLLLVAVLALALAGSSGPDRATIEVVSLPPGAEVLLDEKKLEKLTPLDIPDVDAQVPHHVRVSMRGYDVWESDVKFETGLRQIRLQAVLVPTVGVADVSSTPPGAELYVNNVFRGHTPLTVGDLPPNVNVEVELRLNGYKVMRRVLPWGGQRKLTIAIPLEKLR